MYISLWLNFETMKPQHGAKFSTTKKSFINEYLTSKFLLHLIFMFLSPLIQEFGPFLSQFWVDEVTTLSQNFKVLRERFHKRIFPLRVSFIFDSCFLSTLVDKIPIWTFFIHFCVDDVTNVSQSFQNYEQVVSKTNTLPQMALEITSLGSFWPSFGLMTSSWELKLQHFDKVMSGINSLLQIIKYRLTLSSSIHTWYTALGPFYAIWRYWSHKGNKYSRILKN